VTQHDPQQAGVSDDTLRLLRHLRIRYRENPAVYADLLWLSALALSRSASATELAYENTHASGSTLSTQEAAALAGLKPVTIRRACAEQRLTATKDGRDWRITRTALAEWMTTRAA